MTDEGVLVVEAVILAAGKGTRMKSDRAKVLHELAGRPLLDHVVATARRAGVERTVVVVGHQAEGVQASCAGDDLVFVVQQPQLGTGHAVQVAAPALRGGGLTVVLAGDVPLLRAETLRRLIDEARSSGAAATVLTCVVDDAGAYGRIIRDEDGRLQAIVEARDATSTQIAIGEYNTGIFCFRNDTLLSVLEMLRDDNDQGELYLTDTIAHLVRGGSAVATVTIADPDEVVGINTVAELAAAERLYRARGGE